MAILLTASIPLLGLPLLSSVYAQTQVEPPTPIQPAITVVGEGSAQVEPDIAIANIGVQVANEDVQAASTEAQDLMNAVLAAIQEQGVAEEDVQTSGFA